MTILQTMPKARTIVVEKELLTQEQERFEKECVYYDGKKGKVYADVAKSFLSESNQRIAEATRKEALGEVLERIEGMKIDPPYPNASNNYAKEVDEEDKIYNQALDDLKSSLLM